VPDSRWVDSISSISFGVPCTATPHFGRAPGQGDEFDAGEDRRSHLAEASGHDGC
jgi:hypothetical protein